MRDDPRSPTEPLSFPRWLADMSRALGYAREADLARALGLPQSTVSRWRKGSRPSVEHLVRLSRVLKTELEPLLVLSGHVDADIGVDVLARPPEPPSPRTETVRRIEEADMPEAMRAVLRYYWDKRLQEERARVYRFIDQFSGRLEPSLDEMKDWLAKAYETDLPQHVTGAFMDLLNLQVSTEAVQASRPVHDDYEEYRRPKADREHQLRLVWELYERSVPPGEIGHMIGKTADEVDAMIYEAQAMIEAQRKAR